MVLKRQHFQRLAGWFGLSAGILAVLAAVSVTPVLAQGNPFSRWFSGFPGFGQPSSTDRSTPQADYSRAPAPKKPEVAPTSSILVLGDSMADWLAYGLEEALSDTPELGVIRKHRASSGLIRYDVRNETQTWAQVARELIAADKPRYIVMMIGLHDRQAIRERVTVPAKPGTAAPAEHQKKAEGAKSETIKSETTKSDPSTKTAPARTTTVAHEFRSDKWVELYGKAIDDVIAAMKSGGVPVYWVGLPALRGPKSTADMQYLDELYRKHAEKAGITYVDVWDGFVDEKGRFSLLGPDFEGQTRKLRTSDGVHFTRAGARKLAHFVEREIRRALSRGPVAVALPTSEPEMAAPAAAKPGGPIARPLAGPVVPLTTATGTGGEDLIGGPNSHIASGHVTATRVLVKGEAIPAPAGRGDDFAWPRREIMPFGKDPVVATTTLPLPVMHAPPAATAVLAPTAETPATTPTVARRPSPQPRPEKRQAQQWRPFSGFGGWGGGGLFGGWR